MLMMAATVAIAVAFVAIITVLILEVKERDRREEEYRKLSEEALKSMGLLSWNLVPYFDESIVVKSRQTLEKYDDIKFFKENREKLSTAESVLLKKQNVADILRQFQKNNEFESHRQYPRLLKQIDTTLRCASAYRIKVSYISSAGNKLGEKEIGVTMWRLEKLKEDPSLLMGKGEYNKYLKEKQKEELSQKQHQYYERVNQIIDCASQNRDILVIKGARERLDTLIAQLFDRTVNSIKKIRTTDSEEWILIQEFITDIENEITKITGENSKILSYYESTDFQRIKDTCESLMSSQREFNEYIEEKVQLIAGLFGTRVARNETVREDEYDYIRPYKKTVTPFTAEVSATVFASAENNPLAYVVKYFYPDKKAYPEQIRKLCQLVEELETLKDAKQIIENYKQDYQQYLRDVPTFVMKGDEAGFYSRLGFAVIDESVLTVEYKFCYTSGGGMAQRSFTVPMTEETIAALINTLESKLTASAFAKEQRTLMTRKLRETIKQRDKFTCCICGNSVQTEPNLLLEIDHIIPVSKGGCTTIDNLQTLCWKCNRSKSNKIMA